MKPQSAPHPTSELSGNKDIAYVRSLPRRVNISSVRVLSDLELLATGAYDPLTGFMDSHDYRSVVETLRLRGGAVWSLPVTLPVAEADAKDLRIGDDVALWHDDVPVGLITLTEKFTYDRRKEAREVYATEDDKHPGVAALYRQEAVLLGGPVALVDGRRSCQFEAWRVTPEQMRKRFAERGWRRVVGFQTRNPIHCAHEYITKCALEICDGLLIHPLVGETNRDDIPADVRMKSYQVLLQNYYPSDRVDLAVFPAWMRYAGPREALFHALVRRNYGCTHFIVGRDAAGIGGFYHPLAAQRIFDAFTPDELGITPLCFEDVSYCRKCGGMVSGKTCPHGDEYLERLSGSEVRRRLRVGQSLPREFTRPEVEAILREWITGIEPPGDQGANA